MESNASKPIAVSNCKDLGKKKRVNRSAKLKQCKLDARREQWLSQVKSRDQCKNDSDCKGGVFPPAIVQSKEKSERIETNEAPATNCSDSESPSFSPTSNCSSAVGSNVSGTNFTASCGSSSISTSSSGGSRPESVTGEDDGCLDDWEAVADALVSKQGQGSPPSKPYVESTRTSVRLGSSQFQSKPLNLRPDRNGRLQRDPPNSWAWKPDDALRPMNLPNLSKPHTYPVMNSGRHHSSANGYGNGNANGYGYGYGNADCNGYGFGYGNANGYGHGYGNANGYGRGSWVYKKVVPEPVSCPICCEDLDRTDSAFKPCSCGFRLCLFCHKRIMEDDARCPGCRKMYEAQAFKGDTAVVSGGKGTRQLTRTCTMATRWS